MEGHSLISTDVLQSYAADAAVGTEGVRRLVEGARPRHRGVRIVNTEGVLAVEVHLGLDWGVSAPAVGAAVQERVVEYLGRMTDLAAVSVDVFIDEIGPPAESA